MRTIELHRDMLAERQLGEECVLIPVDDRGVEIFELNAQATELWKKILAGAQEADLCSYLLETYEVDEATARADIDEYLQQLVSIEALTLHPA